MRVVFHLFCGRTSRGHTRSPHLPSAVIARIFIARRINPSLSLVDCTTVYCPTVLHLKKKNSKKTAAYRDTFTSYSPGFRRLTNPHFYFTFVSSMSLAGGDVLCWLLSRWFLLFDFPSFFLRNYSRFVLVFFRLSRDHSWIRSGFVNVK